MHAPSPTGFNPKPLAQLLVHWELQLQSQSLLDIVAALVPVLVLARVTIRMASVVANSERRIVLGMR
jgi:hypothetical protein